MGGPKALLALDEIPWWRLQADRVLAAGIEALWVVSPAVETALRSHADAPSRRVVASDAGPMMRSVMAGIRELASAPPATVLVLPVDVPVPEGRTLARLIAPSTPCVPTFEGRRGHPLSLPWAWVKMQLLSKAIDSDALRLDHLTARDACTIDVDDPSVVVNLNTPEDLAQWKNPPDRSP
ncbi:MAG: NTP transferase domain-containing protein [Phycisphaeraceae bacterium]|nr:NTP transferase domain-containing protein [Phycisphaeraceae bacterium]